MKKKSLTMLLTGLLAMSLTGVGFASWMIVQNDSGEQTGSVAVEEIVQRNVVLNFAWADNDESGIVDEKDSILDFGYKGATNTGWLRNTDAVGETGCKELVFTLSASVEDGEGNGTSATATAAYELSIENSKTNFEKAQGNTTKAGKPYVDNIVISQALDGSDQPIANTYKITVDWGEAFGNKNPYDYYNSFTGAAVTPELISQATEYLTELKSLLEGVTFKLTLTGTYVSE